MSILSKRTGANDTLGDIDRVLNAAEITMCFCGCGRLVDENRPSMYFYGMSCSLFWHASQRRPDPEAWRAEQRAMRLASDEDILTGAAFPGVELPDILPGPGEQPSALDRLDSRPPRSFMVRMRQMAADMLRMPTRNDAHAAAMDSFQQMQERLVRDLSHTARNTSLAASLAEVQREDEALRERLRRDTWSVTYVDGSAFLGGGTAWRVDCGDRSEIVYVEAGQNHQEIVQACVERLRARQNGRLE